MAIEDWKYEKDVYGDDSWATNKDGYYYELRLFPHHSGDGWAVILVKFDRQGYQQKNLSQRTIFRGTKEKVTAFAKKYIERH
jgi:hypothetical protein